MKIDEVCYAKTIKEFLQRENKWFAAHILEITKRHKVTVKQAKKYE